MAGNTFNEGVRPGGLTTGTEIRILLCYLLDSVSTPVTRDQIEEALLGEELVNYFVMAESLGTLLQQELIMETSEGYIITETGRTVARTLARGVPRTVRDAAIRGVIRAQQFAAMKAAHHSEVQKTDAGYMVQCSISDAAGSLFKVELYMPDVLSAEAVKSKFIANGDEVYKLVLASLTGDTTLAEKP
jgi:hypothetical protein